MVKEQKKFFGGLNFKECEFQYAFGKQICYKGPDGSFYRIDHFGGLYVIEYAENEDEAILNRFEDADLYDDTIPEKQLIADIQADLKKYVAECHAAIVYD